MKLRNKKTGEHGEYQVISAGYLIRVRNCDTNESCQYDCLAGFKEDWEDYRPDESDPGYTVAAIQKLENSVKALDARLKAIEVAQDEPCICCRRREIEKKEDRLRKWAKEHNITKVRVHLYDELKCVRFEDAAGESGSIHIAFWPQNDLTEGAVYEVDELLAGEEDGKEDEDSEEQRADEY